MITIRLSWRDVLLFAALLAILARNTPKPRERARVWFPDQTAIIRGGKRKHYQGV